MANGAVCQGMLYHHGLLPVATILAGLVLAGPLPAAAFTPVHADAASRSVSEIQSFTVLAGHAELRGLAGATWTALDPGARTPARGEVRTGAEALRVQTSKGAVIEIGPQSLVAFTGETEMVVDGEGRIVPLHLDLRRGEVMIEQPDASLRRAPKTGPVLVHGHASLLALGQRGVTRVRLLPARAGQPEAMVVASYEGALTQVTSQIVLHRLPAGRVVTLHAGAASSAPLPLGAGPEWVPEDGVSPGGALALVSEDGAKETLSVQFAATPGALGYEVEIARDDKLSGPLMRRALPAGQTRFTTPPLAPGRYFARVRARGADGLPGRPGPTRALRVARLALPAGGISEGGTIVLQKNGAIALDDAQGLEISRGNAGFCTATPTFGPALGVGPQQVRVRLVGERGFVPLILVPLKIRAEIEMGPKLARWPADPIDLQVRIVPSLGVPPLYEPTFKVTVNTGEVPVTWRRDGEIFHATLAPVSTPGPWVVRVETSDPQGNELGRAFLEVDRAATP